MTPSDYLVQCNPTSLVLGALRRGGVPHRYQDDLLQDVFEAALTNPTFQEAIDNQYASQWLIRTALNLAGNFRRSLINSMTLQCDLPEDKSL